MQKYLICLIVIVFLSGCSGSSTNTAPISSGPTSTASGSFAPPKEFSSEMSFVAEINDRKQKNLSAENQGEGIEADEFTGIDEFFRPKEGLRDSVLESIMVTKAYVMYVFSDGNNGNSFNFQWSRIYDHETYLEANLGHGDIEEFVEYAGTRYLIQSYMDLAGISVDSHLISWVQHNQCFAVFIPDDYPIKDILAFCDAEPVVVSEYIEQHTS